MNSKILKYAFTGAGITLGWILVVVTIMFNAESWFGGRVPEENMLVPVMMLLLFVVSAAVTSMGVFGRPLMWYLDGRKKEAVVLAVATISMLAIVGVIILLFLLFS